eukprot:XP_011610657.1 PREDICTED: uncharacterized protein LOC105417611 isoform X1 [Takifugu rubripes]
MAAFWGLVCLWALVVTQARGDVQFLERREGESVLLPCALERGDSPPLGVYLKRTWLRPGEVMFMYTGTELSATTEGDKKRIGASGDPSSRAVNVSISQLRVGDTDRYRCEFVVGNAASADLHLPGTTDFFLLVTAGDAGGPLDIDLVQACVGGSALISCPPPHGARGTVEGVILKRRRGDAVEVLYDSKRHPGSTSAPSPIPKERIQVLSAPGPAGFTHNLSLQRLLPHDGGLYSCQTLHADGPVGAGLGTRAIFVSVEGHCSCSGTPALLYALSAVVVFLFILLCLTVVVFQTKSRRSVQVSRQAPVYEEMVGMLGTTRGPGPRAPGETEYKKSFPENHYETPRGRLRKTDQE